MPQPTQYMAPNNSIASCVYKYGYGSEVYLGGCIVSELGYRYFGARYYESDLSVWLSVDPLASKYPGTSPYMYCLGNPVRLIDPTGMSSEPAKGVFNKAWNWARGHGWENGRYSGTFYGKHRKLDANSVANLPSGSGATKKEYIRFKEKTIGVKWTKEQRAVIPDGCIGLVKAELKIDTDQKPDTRVSFDDASYAFAYIEANQENLKEGEQFVLFALEFATDDENKFRGDPKTHRVNVRSQEIYKDSFYNYYLYDSASGKWWGANWADPGMIIDVNSRGSVENGIPSGSFDRIVYSVTIKRTP